MGTYRLSAFANSVAFHSKFSLFFCFFWGGKSMTHFSSPLSLVFLSVALSFFRQFWDISVPLINGALPHFLPDTFIFLRVLFWPPSISFFTGQIDLLKERDWLLFVCSFVPPHCVLKGLTHTRQNQSIALSVDLFKTTDNLIKTWCCSRRNLISGWKESNKIYHGRPITVYHIVPACPLSHVPGETESSEIRRMALNYRERQR